MTNTKTLNCQAIVEVRLACHADVGDVFNPIRQLASLSVPA
jgi:hypothetical protein